MKDYFAAIIKVGVTGVLRCTKDKNSRQSGSCRNANDSTLEISDRGTWGTNSPGTVHLSTPHKQSGVPTQANKTTVSHLVHLSTPKKHHIVVNNDEFEERAAIIEYDGGLSRQEAELLAYQSLKTLAIH